jgi:hypothetical protein
MVNIQHRKVRSVETYSLLASGWSWDFRPELDELIKEFIQCIAGADGRTLQIAW